jgi:hypothetical protein
MNVANAGLIETWRWYDVAPVTGLQLNVGLFDTPISPLPGDRSAGAAGTVGPAGAPAVLKLHSLEYGLVPPVLVALTRQ